MKEANPLDYPIQTNKIMGINFFKTPADFREWLEKNHLKEKELIVGYYKKDTGRPSMTWPESVQQALCFGWIDGIRRSIDDQSYCIRFTPRNPKSIWSAINLKYMEDLIAQNLVAENGLKLYRMRDLKKAEIYSYERSQVTLSDEYLKVFKKNKKGFAWFSTSPPSYQKPAINWVMSAKQESTQKKRLTELITDSENHQRIKNLRPLKTKSTNK